MTINKYTAGKTNKLIDRFRGFLPVVVDVETGGFNSQTDALLEVAATLLEMDESGMQRKCLWLCRLLYRPRGH